MPRLTAVLTGDIVASTRAGRTALDATMRALGDAALAIGAMCNADARFTRFRGDGWQMLAARPEYAFRAALLIIATLRADPALGATRIGIGFGPIDGAGTRDLSDAAGPAFERSGRALEKMLRNERLVTETESGGLIGRAHEASVILLDERTRRWTPEQAEVMRLYLFPENTTQKEIAQTLGITPQAVNYRLGGAGAPAIREALLALEEDMAARLT